MPNQSLLVPQAHAHAHVVFFTEQSNQWTTDGKMTVSRCVSWVNPQVVDLTSVKELARLRSSLLGLSARLLALATQSNHVQHSNSASSLHCSVRSHAEARLGWCPVTSPGRAACIQADDTFPARAHFNFAARIAKISTKLPCCLVVSNVCTDGTSQRVGMVVQIAEHVGEDLREAGDGNRSDKP